MLVYARLHFIQKLLTVAGPFSGQVSLLPVFLITYELKRQPENSACKYSLAKNLE